MAFSEIVNNSDVTQTDSTDVVQNPPEYLDLTAEDIKSYGWRLRKRNDGQEFTLAVKIKPGLDMSRVFSTGEGLLAIHQVRELDGQLREGYHLDQLKIGRDWGGEVMRTLQDASSRHPEYIVLERSSNWPH